jgi:hypothetical protein
MIGGIRIKFCIIAVHNQVQVLLVIKHSAFGGQENSNYTCNQIKGGLQHGGRISIVIYIQIPGIQ